MTEEKQTKEEYDTAKGKSAPPICLNCGGDKRECRWNSCQGKLTSSIIPPDDRIEKRREARSVERLFFLKYGTVASLKANVNDELGIFYLDQSDKSYKAIEESEVLAYMNAIHLLYVEGKN